MSPRRWFEPDAVTFAISSLTANRQGPTVESTETSQQQQSEIVRNVTFAAGGMALFLAVMITALVLFAEREDPNKQLGPEAVLFPALMILGAGAVAWYMTAQSQKNRLGTDMAFLEIANQAPGLSALGGPRLVGADVGTIPWFHTEELINDEQWNVRIHLTGQYRDRDLVYLECTHVVDPMGSFSALGRTLGSLASSRQKRLHLRSMDAVVFFEPLPELADLLVVPKPDGSLGNYRNQLSGVFHELERLGAVPKSVSRKYWVVSSESDSFDRLFQSRLASLLGEHKWCILQILGGYCVVITGRRPKSVFSQAARTEKQIAADLQFASEVFDVLQAYATGSLDTPIAMGVESAETAPAEPAPVAVPAVSNIPADSFDIAQTPFAPPGGTSPAPTQVLESPPRSCLGTIARVCSAGIGSLLLFVGIWSVCMYGGSLLLGSQSKSWPTAQATIVESAFEESRFGDSVSLEPRFEYDYVADGQEYTNGRIQFGFSRTKAVDEADEIQQAYPQGAQVTVRYYPRMHSVATLRTGVYRQDFTVFGLGFGVFLLLVGAGMFWLGVRRRRPKHVVA